MKDAYELEALTFPGWCEDCGMECKPERNEGRYCLLSGQHIPIGYFKKPEQEPQP